MSAPQTDCRFGEFRIEPALYTISNSRDRRRISPREMTVLMYLIACRDRIVSVDELRNAAWPGEVVDASVIHSHVDQLRNALGDSTGEPRYIKTIIESGYQAIAAVGPAETDSSPRGSEAPLRAYHGHEPYVFICYSHADSEVVYTDLRWLRERGVRFWFDEGITPGSEWTEALGSAVERASAFLFLVSPNSQASKHCRDELGFAVANAVPVIAVHLQPTQLSAGLRLSLGSVQAIHKYQLGDAIYREKLLAVLASLTARRLCRRCGQISVCRVT